MVKSVQGAEIKVNDMDGVTVDGAKVVQADIAADNGVIHVDRLGDHAEAVSNWQRPLPLQGPAQFYPGVALARGYFIERDGDSGLRRVVVASWRRSQHPRHHAKALVTLSSHASPARKHKSCRLIAVTSRPQVSRFSTSGAR